MQSQCLDLSSCYPILILWAHLCPRQCLPNKALRWALHEISSRPCHSHNKTTLLSIRCAYATSLQPDVTFTQIKIHFPIFFCFCVFLHAVQCFPQNVCVVVGCTAYWWSGVWQAVSVIWKSRSFNNCFLQVPSQNWYLSVKTKIYFKQLWTTLLSVQGHSPFCTVCIPCKSIILAASCVGNQSSLRCCVIFFSFRVRMVRWWLVSKAGDETSVTVLLVACLQTLVNKNCPQDQM